MITTFDIRMTRPNFEPVMNTAEIHTIEHLAATFLRKSWRHQRPRDLFWTDGMPYGFLSVCLQEITSPAILYHL